MASLELSHVDLECGRRNEEEAEEDGSVYYSDMDNGSEISKDEALISSSMADCLVDIESGENEVCLNRVERDCRICNSPSHGVVIELGCCCKDDMAAVHKHCADTWFKIKGNNTCEICNSVARNLVGCNDDQAAERASTVRTAAVVATTPTVPVVRLPAETPCCLNHPCNVVFALVIFAVVISWIFES